MKRLIGIAALLAAVNIQAATLIYLEEPSHNSVRSGIGNLRGWVVSTESINKVDYSLDGIEQGQIPYGGTRQDVAAAYPNVPNSGRSGFSMAINYSNLGPGEHVIEIAAGETVLQSRFSVVGFDQPFISGNPELAGAEVYPGFYSLHVNKAWFPGEGERDLELEWSAAAQQFLIIENSPHDEPPPPVDTCGFSPPNPACR